MISQTNTPPSSSPAHLALDSSIATIKRTSSKRKNNESDVLAHPATKRRSSPPQLYSEQDDTGFVNSLKDDNFQHPGVRARNGQSTSRFPLSPGHGEQRQRRDLPVSRLVGMAASKALSKAAIVRPPGDGFPVHQGQAVPIHQLSSSEPARPPPHSAQNQGYSSYNVSHVDNEAFQQCPWFDSNAVAAPSTSGPPYAVPQSLEQPRAAYDVSYPPSYPPSNFSGHYYQPHPVFQQTLPGTASCPIVLDDIPQNTTPTNFHMSPQPPPQLSTNYSIDSTSFSRDTEARPAAFKSLMTPSPTSSLGIAGNSQRYFVSQPDEGIDSQVPPIMWHATSSTPLLSEHMYHPYGGFDLQPAMIPSIIPHEYPPRIHQTVPQAPANFQPAMPPVSFCEPATNTPARKSVSPLPTDEPSLCPEQAALVDLIMQGHNVFYTGSAGCGKSTVLRVFVKKLKDMGKIVRIVAPTGRAALNVGGMTTWTFAGWTPNSHKKQLGRLKIEAAASAKVSKRLKETDVLVIDEISMVENLHFERLNEIMKAVHHKPHTADAAFGGCQIVVTGDFCQLPPVKPFQHCIYCGKELTQKIEPGEKRSYHCRHHGSFPDEDKWAFRSKAWEECGFKNIHLRTIHRQNDEPFIRMLQKCRLGSPLSEQEIHLLMNHKNRTSQAMELYPTRKEADDVNTAKFNKIVAEAHTYWAHDSFFWHKEHHPNLQWKGVPSEWRNSWTLSTPQSKRPLKALEEHRYNECVQLKKGGLVVLLTNLDLKLGLCNGSQGLVCGFEDYDPTMMPTRDTRGEPSWGKRSTDKVDLKPGQRVVRGEHAGLQEQEIKNFITSECAPIKQWPIVRFHNGQKCTVYAECSITQLGDEEPYSMLARTQLPLAPAWAMTIHKSQSLTLDRVIVNLDRVFEEGQVYVALSRATGLYGLKIEGNGHFLRNRILVNPEVAAFLKEKFGDIYDGIDDPKVKGLESVEAL